MLFVSAGAVPRLVVDGYWFWVVLYKSLLLVVTSDVGTNICLLGAIWVVDSRIFAV